jgi:hypothetical protein
MANVTINTNITGVDDDQSSTLSASLDGVPNSVSTIITSRKFTPKTNYKFVAIPHVSFMKTSDPNRYNYSVIKGTDESYSFTVNYSRPLSSPPTADVIEFFAKAKANVAAVGDKIYGWNMKTTSVSPYGESRTLNITGDPGAKLKIAVTENPKIGPESNAVYIVDEFTAYIGIDGLYSTILNFPSTTLNTNYRILLTESVSSTFSGGLKQSPTTIYLEQWPLQQTKLQIIETGDTSWVLPSGGINSDYFYYSGKKGTKSTFTDFSFTCTHANDISADGVFTSADFTQVTGQDSTLSEETVDSTVQYRNLSYTIDNTGTQSVIISGQISVTHGFDAGGHTYITLNINDILNHA